MSWQSNRSSEEALLQRGKVNPTIKQSVPLSCFLLQQICYTKLCSAVLCSALLLVLLHMGYAVSCVWPAVQ